MFPPSNRPPRRIVQGWLRAETRLCEFPKKSYANRKLLLHQDATTYKKSDLIATKKKVAATTHVRGLLIFQQFHKMQNAVNRKQARPLLASTCYGCDTCTGFLSWRECISFTDDLSSTTWTREELGLWILTNNSVWCNFVVWASSSNKRSDLLIKNLSNFIIVGSSRSICWVSPDILQHDVWCYSVGFELVNLL